MRVSLVCRLCGQAGPQGGGDQIVMKRTLFVRIAAGEKIFCLQRSIFFFAPTVLRF